MHLTGHLTPDSTSASDQSELEHNAVDQRDSVIREKCFSSGHRKIFYNDFCILLSHLGKGVTPLIKKSYAARACRIHHHPGYVVSGALSLKSKFIFWLLQFEETLFFCLMRPEHY